MLCNAYVFICNYLYYGKVNTGIKSYQREPKAVLPFCVHSFRTQDTR